MKNQFKKYDSEGLIIDITSMQVDSRSKSGYNIGGFYFTITEKETANILYSTTNLGLEFTPDRKPRYKTREEATDAAFSKAEEILMDKKPKESDFYEANTESSMPAVVLNKDAYIKALNEFIDKLT